MNRVSLPKKEQTFKSGDMFALENGDVTMLVQTTYGKFSLISLENGNRYSEAIKVKNTDKITLEELSSMADSFEEFSKVNEVTITKDK